MNVEYSKFQQWLIDVTNRGAGVDSSPSAMNAKQRREADALVSAGLLEKSKNHSNDKYGMYVKKLSPEELARKKREYGYN